MTFLAGNTGGQTGAVNSRATFLEQLSETLQPRGGEPLRKTKAAFALYLSGRTGDCGGFSAVSFDAGDITLAYSGSIYNIEELRAALRQKEAAPQDETTAAALLAAYLAFGEGFPARLLGTFAVAVFDERRQTLVLARDQMGVQPLFYTRHKDAGILFASQIKGILSHPAISAQTDHEGVADLLLLGPGRTPGFGVFKGIRELKPGHMAVFPLTGQAAETVAPYWQFEARPHTDSLDETMAHTRFLISDAVKRQTRGKRFGAMLSGGVDSSVLAALSGAEHTFSLDYEENDLYFKSSAFQPDSDKAYINIMRDFLGSTHETVTVGTDDLIESLFDAVHARDLPGMGDVDGSMLLFCRAVQKRVPTVLSGECADEFFGGYPWYRNEALRKKTGFPWSQSTDYRALFLKDELLQAINPIDYVTQRYEATVKNGSFLPDEPPEERRMKELFLLNAQWFMQTLIDRTDRMSAAAGLDVRIPFCDRRVADYAYQIPWRFKDFEGREKGLLRQAMTGVIPDAVLWRKKSPFPKTYHPAYLKKVRAILSDIIAAPNAPILSLLKKKPLEILIQAADSQTGERWYGQLMTTPQTIAYFIQLNEWLTHYRVALV